MKLWIIIITFIICIVSDAQLQNQINDKQTQIEQLQQQNNQLLERIDANDAIVNKWLMEGGK